MLKSTDFDVSAIADNTLMTDPISLYERLLAVKPEGLSRNAWIARAGVNRNFFTDVRKRGNASHEIIEKMLDAIGVTWAEFEAGAQAPSREVQPASGRAPYMAFRGQERPRDIPILGTAQCADLHLADNGEAVDIEAMELDQDDVVDYVRRPLTLDGRQDVYAIYYRGVSMAPRYEPGELGYVDPRRPPATGDYVVAQLRRPDAVEGERIFTVIAKRLVRQTANFYEFEQFNPPLTFKLPREQVAHLHRIYPWDELVSF